uniref:Uncharacterized protein n=1 Tax=Candidatus Kentrum sp. DK TaxID=2126562 RepID=A0A450TCU0_9GAMM|nr:MAG: hypothetical protein BECKDK2373B_GA0170837_113910 [Candidatus Kentron sp. DK]
MTDETNKETITGIAQATTALRMILAILCFGLLSVIFMPVFVDQKETNVEIDALRNLANQISLLNEQISQLAKATFESNTLKEKVDELKQEIVLIKHEQTKSRDKLTSIDTNIDSLSYKIGQLKDMLSDQKSKPR